MKTVRWIFHEGKMKLIGTKYYSFHVGILMKGSCWFFLAGRLYIFVGNKWKMEVTIQWGVIWLKVKRHTIVTKYSVTTFVAVAKVSLFAKCFVPEILTMILINYFMNESQIYIYKKKKYARVARFLSNATKKSAQKSIPYFRLPDPMKGPFFQ